MLLKCTLPEKHSVIREIIRCHRGCRPEVFCKKGALRSSTKFTGKYLCQSLFFNKVAGLLQKRLFDIRKSLTPLIPGRRKNLFYTYKRCICETSKT